MLCKKPIACNECDLGFETEVDLSTHMLFSHFSYKPVIDYCIIDQPYIKKQEPSTMTEAEYEYRKKIAFEKLQSEKIKEFVRIQKEKEKAFAQYNKILREQKKIIKKYGRPDGKTSWLCVYCGYILTTKIEDMMPVLAKQHLEKKHKKLLEA